MSTTGHLGRGCEVKVEQCYSPGGEREKQNGFIWGGRLSRWQGLGGKGRREGGMFLQDQKKTGCMACGLGVLSGVESGGCWSKSSCYPPAGDSSVTPQAKQARPPEAARSSQKPGED